MGTLVNISSNLLAPTKNGDTVLANFGIGNYSSQALAAGYSPYPTGFNLLIIALVPAMAPSLRPNTTEPDWWPSFAVSAEVRSNDGAVSVPIQWFPAIGPLGGLPLTKGSFSGNGLPTVPVALFQGQVSFSLEVSQLLFNPDSFSPGNRSAAQIVVHNLGDDFTMGIGDPYSFAIANCCISVTGIHGAAPFGTGGNTGSVLFVAPDVLPPAPTLPDPLPTPEPSSLNLLIAGSLALWLGTLTRPSASRQDAVAEQQQCWSA
ncbi:MAG: hypothetical protein JWO19_2815 [Bryobacterales bacterium]|nr:hypothetical protein [Bryobacterales bacterium]